ncbi:MAG: hypothetical protein QXW39_08095 [Candidatus Bathyarchaeia archaeon]
MSTEGYGKGFSGRALLFVYDQSTGKYYPVSGEIVGDKIVLHGFIYDSNIMVPVDNQAVYKPSGSTLYSGMVTSNGSTSSIDVSNVAHIRVMVKVTSVSGTTPTLDVYVEGLYEGTGDWVSILSRTGINATGVYDLGQVSPLVFRQIRVRWVVGGTNPSFNITVAIQSLTVS